MSLFPSTVVFVLLLVKVSTAQIAFSAELSTDREISSGGTIVFDNVIANAGGLYANTSGQFLCQNGVFVFTWNLMKATSSALPGMRAIGSLRSLGIDLKYGPKTSYESTSISGVAQMTRVYQCTTDVATIVMEPWAPNTGANAIFHLSTTSFSGFKLDSSIAFTAELSADQLAFPGARVVFDKVLANYGDNYDETHSFFRCPDAGVYVFSISTYSNLTNQWSVSRLMMEKEVLMQGPITYWATSDEDSGSSSTTTVVECIPGLSVYVEAQSAYNFLYNSYGKELTSFSGFKLYNVTIDTIAFTVVMSQNFTATSAMQPLPFNEVITNIGNAFDVVDLRFTCPDDSYFMFTWSIVLDSSYGSANLYLDGLLVKQHYTTSQTSEASSGTSGNSAQSVILPCQTGSRVQLASKDAGDPFLGGFCSFSGYRIPG